MTGFAHVFDGSTDWLAHGESRGGSWRLAGRVAVQAFSLALALVVFTNTHDRGQTVLVALIGLVFVSLRATTVASACAQQRVALLLENQLRAARQAPVTGATSTLAETALERSLDAATKALRIEYAGLAAIGALCLYHLATAIIYGMAYQQLLELR